MHIKTSVWVHGTIAQVEDPASLAKISRKGWGVTFTGKPDKLTWFHFPITTSAILDYTNPTSIPIKNFAEDITPPLTKVYIFFVTSKAFGPQITNVHLYDGFNKIKGFDDLASVNVRFGDHGSKPDAENSWEIKPPLKISHGLGVSVGVQFPGKFPNKSNPDLLPTDMNILFTAVGADFQKP